MTVVVVGAGIGGLSLALALARRGVRSTVLEQAPAIAEVGAGVQLSPNVVRTLAHWGIGDAVSALAVEPERVEVRSAASDRLLMTSRLGSFSRQRWGAPYLTIARSGLQAVLLEAARASGGVEIRLGARVADVAAVAGAVTLDDGDQIVGEAVVGCDGLRSVVQARLFGAIPPRFTGQTAWRGIARMQDPEPVVRVFTGPRRHFVRYPIGAGLVNMVAVKEASADEVEAWDAVGAREDLAAAFAGWPPSVRETIAAVERPWRQALYARRPLARWSVGRVTLLGDAAHPMLPFLAQGAGMAIEDAEALAERLATPGDTAAALVAYQSARLPRTAKVQAWAERNARLFHLPEFAAATVFGAAGLTARPPEARLDWLYGA